MSFTLYNAATCLIRPIFTVPRMTRLARFHYCLLISLCYSSRLAEVVGTCSLGPSRYTITSNCLFSKVVFRRCNIESNYGLDRGNLHRYFAPRHVDADQSNSFSGSHVYYFTSLARSPVCYQAGPYFRVFHRQILLSKMPVGGGVAGGGGGIGGFSVGAFVFGGARVFDGRASDG